MCRISNRHTRCIPGTRSTQPWPPSDGARSTARIASHRPSHAMQPARHVLPILADRTNGFKKLKKGAGPLHAYLSANIPFAVDSCTVSRHDGDREEGGMGKVSKVKFAGQPLPVEFSLRLSRGVRRWVRQCEGSLSVGGVLAVANRRGAAIAAVYLHRRANGGELLLLLSLFPLLSPAKQRRRKHPALVSFSFARDPQYCVVCCAERTVEPTTAQDKQVAESGIHPRSWEHTETSAIRSIEKSTIPQIPAAANGGQSVSSFFTPASSPTTCRMIPTCGPHACLRHAPPSLPSHRHCESIL